MAAQELIIDLQRKRFVADLRGAEWQFPSPYHSEVLGLRCRFLTLNADGDAFFNLGNFSLQSVSGAALTVAILRASDNSVLASQTSWNYDAANNVITGLLNLYQSAMITAIGSSATLACRILVKLVTASDGTYIVTNNLTVNLDPIASGVPAPSPAASYYTKEEMDARYLKKVSDAGDVWTSKSPDGTHQRILGVRNDGSAQDDVV